jgi:PadR family transcriptional regulator PadR
MTAMPDRTLQILLALLEGPAHGYGIKQRVEERTAGRVRLGSGTLYEAVHRLVGAGQIEEVDVPETEPSSGGPPRRFYALTPAGRTALTDEVRRLESLVSYAKDHALLPDA